MLNFQLLVFGDKIVTAKYRAMANATGNLIPSFHEVEDYLMDITGRQFDSQGRRGGGSWKPLSPKWVARKTRMGGDTRILHFDKALRRSVTKRGAGGQILEYTPTSLTFGTSIAYAARHQFGHGKTPRRKFLVILPLDRKMITEMIQSHIMTPWVKTGVLAFGGGKMLRGPRGRFMGVSR